MYLKITGYPCPYNILFYFIFKLYNIVLVLPNIEMNLPQVYVCSPSWTLFPPPSSYHPLGHPSAQALVDHSFSSKEQASSNFISFFSSRFDARYWMLGAGALGRPRGMVWGGREEGSGWGTHVYLWWIHFDIWQNQYNIVKFKNKIKFKKKKKK